MHLLDFISNKKVMIFAPHQDDEINIAGGLIPLLIHNDNSVCIVYSTNGDYCTKAKTRIIECKKALSKLEIGDENIYFMGYSDQTREKNTHLYMTDENLVWESRKNCIETYHPFNDKEVAMIFDGKHHTFNRENFIYDIKSIIENEKPDIIFCIDFDSHPDHRALSLGVECALGTIINYDKQYRPIVYKAFAYPTFYYGYRDLNNINIKSTMFKTEPFSFSKMENPYYEWEKRIRFPLEKESYNKLLLRNRVYKALRCHKSQCIIGKAKSTINGDQIFWQRRTDNLLNIAEVKATSGNVEKLYDFMLFDSNYIMNGNSKVPVIENNAWIPNIDDVNPTIFISFGKDKVLSQINFYHTVNKESFISKIMIECDDGYKKEYHLDNDKMVSCINLQGIKTSKLTIKIIERTGEKAGFSEIEIFSFEKTTKKLIKLEIDHDFAYDYVYDNQDFRVYSYDGYYSDYLKKDEYEILSDSVEIRNNKFVLKKKKNIIRVQLKKNPKVFDEVVLIRNNFLSRFINEIVNVLNDICVFGEYAKQKIIRKIKRLMKIN